MAGPTGSNAFTQRLVGTGIVVNTFLGNLLANGTILYAILRETAGHNVNVSIGTTTGGVDILAPVTVTASTSLVVPVTSFLLNWFSASATQAIFINSASWSSASININLVFQVGP